MSGTASRFQTRLGYAPGLRVGQYPGAAAPVEAAPPPAGVTPGSAAPVVSTALPYAPPASIAPGAAPPVMAGSMRPDRLPGDQDGAGGGAEYGGPGPSGIGSTGSVLSDIAGFGRDAGVAALGMTNPMGIAGFGLGTLASGFANAIGAPQTASAIARAIGLPGLTASGVTGENPKGVETEFGMSATPPGTAALGPSDMSAIGPAPDKDSLSAPTAEALSGGYGDKGDFGGADNSGGSAQGENTSAGDGGSEDGGGKGGDWMRGGYTGAGADGVVQPNRIAGRVHEGEAVIPASAVARYGLTPLMLLARGKVEPSQLSALLRA